MSKKTLAILFLVFAPIYTVAELVVGETPNYFMLISLICAAILLLTKR